MQRKGIIALGFLVGVAIVAGILRIKFYFDPPQDNFDLNISNFLADDAATEDTTDSTTVTLTATPQAVDTVHYTVAQQYDLGDGIVLDLMQQDDHFILVQLQGSELVTVTYDQAWQPIADSRRVIQTGAQLVGGLPPSAQLGRTATGYVLVQQQAQSDQTYDVVVRSYTTDWQEQSTSTLLDDLSIMEGTSLQVTSEGVWLLLNAETMNYYSITGQLLFSQQFTITATGVCDLIPDGDDVVVVLESSTEMTLQKQTQYGDIVQAVAFPHPDQLVGCVAVQRFGQRLVVQLVDRLVPYTDNLSEQYDAISVASAQLFPQLLLGDQSIWLAYSSSTTLGQYQMHLKQYDQSVTAAVTEAPLDATTAYTD